MSPRRALCRSVGVALIASVLASGCSVRRYAVDMVGGMLAEGGDVYTADDDLVLVGDALPFSLKLLESLLATSPDNRGLLIAAARGYLLYAYAYVHHDAEMARDRDLSLARELLERARKLYLRANGYALRALEVRYPGIGEALQLDPERAVATVTGTSPALDAEDLYWSAASLGLAISVAKSDPALLARLPEVRALLGRALEIDEAWSAGVLHEFAIVLAGARPGAAADRARLQASFERALSLSGGRRASLFVTYAEAVAVPAQDRAMFEQLLGRALAVDLDAAPELRLMNAVSQRRSRWLLERTDMLFLN